MIKGITPLPFGHPCLAVRQVPKGEKLGLLTKY